MQRASNPAARSCFKCTWCSLYTNADSTLEHVCRHKPPHVQVNLVPGSRGPELRTVTVWPTVTEQDWCKEFQRGQADA